jgi:two-component system, sensor histidine kinase and response regulator
VSLREIMGGRARLAFSVRDTGVGIPEDQQQAVFQAFQQAHTSGTRLYGGTGLGLAVSRSLVGLMGGSIELTSKSGIGTTVSFTATFPLSAAPGAEADASAFGAAVTPAAEPVARGTEGVRGLPVLIVDDNTTSRENLSELAGQWKMEWHACDSGSSALAELSRAALAGHPYRLLLLDEQMPGMDGFEVLERMRGDPRLLLPVVMMLTSSERNRSVERCRQFAVERYFIKPAMPSELLASLRLALGLEASGSRILAPASRVSPSSRSLRILLAEDNLVNQKVAMTMLNKMGHRITLATNGREAVERWRSSEFDLVLMDVQMPEMTGLEATMQIRQEEHGFSGHLPIIAMTASAMVEDRERCLSAGMDDIVPKPISFAAIEQLIAARFFEPQAAEARQGAS